MEEKPIFRKQIYITGDCKASFLNDIAEDISQEYEKDFEIVIILSRNLSIEYDEALDFKYELA